jgi:hypothetical protein
MIPPEVHFGLTLVAFIGTVTTIVNSVKLAARGFRRLR